MAKEYFRTPSAVFPIILRREGGRTQILLHLRQNTASGTLQAAATSTVGRRRRRHSAVSASRSWASAFARRTQSSRV